MIETEFWPPLAAPLLNGFALLLAFGFRRNRAVIVLAILTFASMGLAGIFSWEQGERGIDAARMFAPWLLLAAAAMPERRLFARRNLALMFLLTVSVWLTLAAPVHVWPGLRDALPLGMLPWRGDAVAAGMIFLAASLCLLRWVLRNAPMELSLSVVLVLVGIALFPGMRLDSARGALALAGTMAIAAILHASYRMAFLDGLAGLPNRRALDEALARLSGDYALAMADIDHFKQFNDTHGHDAGDRVLKSVAEQLKNTRGASAFRYGGEEFCLLFTGTRMRNALQACEDVRERIEKMRVRVRSAPTHSRRRQPDKSKDPTEVRVTISMGLAERGGQLRESADVLKAADAALYKAKAKGRNRVVSH